MTFDKSTRDLDIRVKLTLTTGVEKMLSASEIASYSIDEESASSGYVLGEAPAASYELEFANTKHEYSVLQLAGATVSAEVGILTGSAYTYSPFGVWKVQSAQLSRQSATATLRGSDALAYAFEGTWADPKYPTTLGGLVSAACTQAKVPLASATFPNSTFKISKRPKWEKGISIRAVLSYAVACAGGFARINRQGKLEVVSYARGKSVGTITPSIYRKLQTGDGQTFAFNCLAVRLKADDENFTRFPIADKADTASNTLQIDSNPLLTTKTSCTTVRDLLRGFTSAGISVDWVGDPSVRVGDLVQVQDLDGTTLDLVVNQQTLDFDGGLHAVTSARLASETQSSSSYVVNDTALNANGLLQGGKLVTESVTAEALAAGSVTAEKIEAGAVTTEKLDAKSVTTEKLAAGAVTADKIAAGTITADNIQAGALDANTIKAVTAEFQKIQAQGIEVDDFAARMAAVTVLIAGSATFDKATIQHLVAEAMNLQFGVADQVFIKNLTVEYAQLVGATVGNLVIKATDGNYYRLDVAADGTVTTTKVTPSQGEIDKGETTEGQFIVESQITAKDLSTSNLLASFALINKLQAATIDVDQLFARTAFIDKLVTSSIIGGKSLTIIAGEAADANNKIDTLQVGGTNLIPDSKYEVATVGTFYIPTYKILAPYIGQDVVFSVDLKSDTPNKKFSVYAYQGNGISIADRFDNNDMPTGQFKRFSFRTKAAQLGTNPAWSDGEIIIYDPSGVGTFHVRNPKIELGHVPSDWSPAPQDAEKGIADNKESINNLNVVGKNLILNTATPNLDPSAGFWTHSRSEVSKPDSETLMLKAAGSSPVMWSRRTDPFEPSQVYTLSCVAKIEGGGSLRVVIDTGAPTTVVGESVLTGEFARYTFTFTMPSTIYNPTGIAFNFYMYETVADSALFVRKIKCEKGNRATDWSPAPQDIAAMELVVSKEAPPDPPLNKLWLDTSVMPSALRQFTGADESQDGWELVTDTSVLDEALSQLQHKQSETESAVQELQTALSVRKDGVHVYKDEDANEVLITDRDVQIRVSGDTYSRFLAGGIQLGNMLAWQPSSGGLAFAPKGGK